MHGPTMIEELTDELNATTENANEALDKIRHLERETEDLYSKFNEMYEELSRLDREVDSYNG